MSKPFNLRLLGLALVPFWASSCAKTFADDYYLPCKYTGWVNVIYGGDGPSRVIANGPQRVFLLTGDLTRCYVNLTPMRGNYTIAYYRYCDTGITGPRSAARDKTHVLTEYNTFVTIGDVKHAVYAFYVSDQRLAAGVSLDTLPPNPLPYSLPARGQ